MDGRKVSVVVGASRGIGFALAQLLLETGHMVFATCRTTNDAMECISKRSSNYVPVPGAFVLSVVL
jgi:NAD(P)-dependent dehydrogenase (short-subunit alcohol dehydrogenase family)